MSWRGTIRAIEATERRAQRDAQRRFRELQRQAKEHAKLSALEQARLEVETYDNRIEVLLSVHKEPSVSTDGKRMSKIAEPPIFLVFSINCLGKRKSRWQLLKMSC